MGRSLATGLPPIAILGARRCPEGGGICLTRSPEAYSDASLDQASKNLLYQAPLQAQRVQEAVLWPPSVESAVVSNRESCAAIAAAGQRWGESSAFTARA